MMKDRPETVTKQMLKDWEENQSVDFCVEDCLHRYFGETLALWDWVEISDQVVDVFNCMHPALELEKDSHLHWVIQAGVAQASQGAFEAVAAALDVDAEHLLNVVSHWLENKENPPASVGFCGLRKLVEKEKESGELGL